MRANLTSWLIAVTFLIGELHTFWEGKKVVTQNWIWKVHRPMAIQWNVKFLSLEINGIILALALLYYRPNRLNRTVVSAYVLFTFLDILMYFYNYKTYGYGYIYLVVALYGFIQYKWYKKAR